MKACLEVAAFSGLSSSEAACGKQRAVFLPEPPELLQKGFFSLFLVPTHEVHLRRCLCRAPDGADKLVSSLKSSQDPTRDAVTFFINWELVWGFFKMLYMVSCMKVKWYSAMLHFTSSAEI